MRGNQNIAHCSVCSEKTHCRFSFPNIPRRLHSTESKFHSFLSPNLLNNMGDIWKILIQNGCRFITHSPTISSMGQTRNRGDKELLKYLGNSILISCFKILKNLCFSLLCEKRIKRYNLTNLMSQWGIHLLYLDTLFTS